jgi:Spy/CpxP family protein refolding chaperone
MEPWTLKRFNLFNAENDRKTQMKTYRMTWLAAVVVAGLLASAMVAPAQDAKGKGKRGPSIEQQMDRINEAVKLTDDQKPKVKALLEDTSKKRQELSNVPQEERRTKMRAMMEEQNKKMKDILTPDQYQKYQEIRRQAGEKKNGKQKA